MLFVEFRFLEFFAVVFSIYWILQSNTLRKALLLIASYFFYASFFFGAEPLSTKTLPPGWWFPVLLAASTSVDFFIGLLLDRTPEGSIPANIPMRQLSSQYRRPRLLQVRRFLACLNQSADSLHGSGCTVLPCIPSRFYFRWA